MLGGLIDALDTSKYHCVCVLCPACIEVHDYV